MRQLIPTPRLQEVAIAAEPSTVLPLGLAMARNLPLISMAMASYQHAPRLWRVGAPSPVARSWPGSGKEASPIHDGHGDIPACSVAMVRGAFPYRT